MFDFTNWWITWKSFWATIGAKAGQPKINEAVLNAVLARSVDLSYSDLLALAYASYAEDAGVAVENSIKPGWN